jgi:hypothetical protein
MGAKTVKGMLLCMLYSGRLVVAHVAGACYLAARQIAGLATTAIFRSVLSTIAVLFFF